jgi:hypothetical protein
MPKRLLLTAVLIASAIGTHAQTDELYNYATVWQSWNAAVRGAYVKGVADGAFHAYMTAGQDWLDRGQLTKRPEPEKVARVRERVIVSDVEAQMPSVITDFYQDPGNIYIVLVDMVYVAKDKLEGKDVDLALAAARKHAVEVHRASQKARGNP